MTGLLGILAALAVLIWLSFRGWSVLILAPAAALVAAIAAGEPLLAHWTQTFMGAAAGFIAQFFPLFLLGALFGKLMDDSGSVKAIAQFMTDKLGAKRAILAVVLAGALVTYGGVSLFVAVFVIAPMAQALFRAADIPNRLVPVAILLGTATFTMSALPGTPAIQNAIPMPFFGTTPFAAPGLGHHRSDHHVRLRPVVARAAAKPPPGAPVKGFGGLHNDPYSAAEDLVVRERATTASTFDPAEINHGHHSEDTQPSLFVSMLPLAWWCSSNLLMSMMVLPRLDTSFLATEHGARRRFRRSAECGR